MKNSPNQAMPAEDLLSYICYVIEQSAPEPLGIDFPSRTLEIPVGKHSDAMIIKPEPVRPQLVRPPSDLKSAPAANYCAICDKQFKSLKGLRQHDGKTHSTRQKSIFCNLCGKGFYHKHALKFHINQVHLKNTRIKCPCCEQVFYNKYSMKEHLVKCDF